MFEKLKNMEWAKVLKGAGIAGAGAALTYLSSWVTGQDFGVMTPIVVAGISSLVQFFRKLAAAETE